VTDKWNASERKAKAALAAKDALEPHGPWQEDRPMTEQRGVPVVLRLCGPVQVEQGWMVTEGRIWVGELMDASQYVHALSDVKPRDLVEEIRTRARDCPQYAHRDGMPERAVHPDADVPAPSGLDDFYAYCETANDRLPGMQHCTAIMARDDLLVTTHSWGYKPDIRAARAEVLDRLRQVVPIVADAVLAA
jgi:hypothetical protein